MANFDLFQNGAERLFGKTTKNTVFNTEKLKILKEIKYLTEKCFSRVFSISPTTSLCSSFLETSEMICSANQLTVFYMRQH